MRTIVTAHRPGFLILVDDEDFRALSQHVWNALSNGTHRYAYTSIDGLRVSMHRMLLPGDHFAVDHINGDTLDNRRSNLRPASRALNAMNRTKPARSNTGLRGVHRNKYGLYVAQVQGRYLGQFLTIEAADATATMARQIVMEAIK